MSRKSTSSAPSPSKPTSNMIGNEDGWTDETTKELLNKMKPLLPKPDVSKYKTMLEKFEWSKVKVGKFSSEECKKQWERIYKKLRKFKTLTDLVADSLEYVENPYKGNKKKHPDHPKRPLTPYFRFFLCEREKYAATHKELTNLEITSILSKKYREISVEEKDRYLNEWKEEMVEYRAKLEQFKHDHPEYYDTDPPKMSRTPLQIFNQENVTFVSSVNKKKMTKKQVQEALKSKYHDLEDDQKLPYILKAIEEWDKYKEELEIYKKSHPNFIPTTAQSKSTLTINDWKIHDKSLGKPDRPPANGYNLFCTRMMVSDAMKHMTSRERIMQCGQKWQILTKAEKDAYQMEFMNMRDNYKTEMKNFLKSLTPRQRQEYLERKKANETKKNSKRKLPIHVKEEEIATDSETSSEEQEEEMEINDESSSESSSSSEDDEDDGDEEEQVRRKKKTQPPVAKVTSSGPLRPTTPISALFLYQKAHKEKFAAKHPNLAASDIAIMLARRYNNLPQEKKAKYKQKEKEERAMRNVQMRKQMLGEQEKESAGELKAVTGEQIFQEQNKSSYLKKSNGSVEKAEEMMRRAWTQMSKDRRKKYISVAHEQNAKNIAEHQAAKAAVKDGKKKREAEQQLVPAEHNLSQKEIKSYLALEPKKVPKDGLMLFKIEQKVRLNHLTTTARNQELNRLWSVLSTANKNKYKERAKTGLDEYNKKLQRWIKSLPPQVEKAYQASLEKRSKAKSKDSNEKPLVSNGASKKRKAENTKAVKGRKKGKKEDSDESSDDSSDDSSTSSSDDSDDESDSSSSSDTSSDDSDSTDSDNEKAAKKGGKKQDSSDDSSSSSDDDSDSD